MTRMISDFGKRTSTLRSGSAVSGEAGRPDARAVSGARPEAPFW
jgi:hypothetical protein